MKFEIFDQNDSNAWNDIIDGSINGTFYHRWEWLKIAEKNTSTQLFPLVYFDTESDKPFGAIPLFLMKKLGLKMVFSPPPGCSITLGPVLTKKGYKQHKFELSYLDFQAQVDNFIRGLHPKYVFIMTSPGLLDVRPFSWTNYDVTPFYTYMLDLSPGKDAVWKQMSPSLRTNINSAIRRGIIIRETTTISDIDIVYSALSERYAQQKIRLPLKAQYLRDLYQSFGQTGLRTFLALYDGKVVGSIICVAYKDTFVSWQGGSRPGDNGFESNELLFWHTIEKAIQEGFKWFEIEGANSQHLCDFKSRFNPSISPYFMVRRADLIGQLAEKAYFTIFKPV